MNEPSDEQLRVIQNFTSLATDVCHRFLAAAQYPYADEVHYLFHQLFERADYSTDQSALLSSFRSLPEQDRAELLKYIRDIYLRSPESPVWDPMSVLDEAMSMHWIKMFGLGAADDEAAARRQLGNEDFKRLEVFIHKKVDKFWELDALAEQLNSEPLTVEDMNIVGRTAMMGSDGNLLAEASQFANIEALRCELQSEKLALSKNAAQVLEDGLNHYLQRIRPDRPPVSIIEWLT